MVAPITKSTNLSNPGNYRPISLTCILCKVLEKPIRHLMQEHLQDTGQLSNNQWGFRSQRSTVSALATVTHDWFTALEAGKEMGAVFFDYQKAFDSVPHQPLIEKIKKMSSSSIIVSWVSDFLTSRLQYVVVNGCSSSTVPVMSGVPQGSVLGPILFVIYISDVLNTPLCSDSQIYIYADDILLYHTIQSQADFVDLQRSIDIVTNWSDGTKCKYMIISRRRDPTLPQSSLTICGVDLEKVDTMKYLGVCISNNLSWSTHVNSVCSKANEYWVCFIVDFTIIPPVR